MPASVAPVFGFDGKLYRHSGSYAAPTWVLVENMGDNWQNTCWPLRPIDMN